jgi:hypothetical protein
LIAKVFDVTDYNVTAVAMFVLFQAVCLFFVYALSSIISKMVRAIWTTRASAVCCCIFLFLTIYYEDKIANYYMLFGAFWGICQGIYWGGVNFLTTSVFKADKTHGYFTVLTIAQMLASIIFPFTFGFAIDVGSWFITGLVVLVIGIIMLCLTWIVSPEKQVFGMLSLRKYFSALKQNKMIKPAISLWVICALWGPSFLFSPIMAILIVLAYGTNLSLGIMGSVFSVVGIIGVTIYKWSNRKSKAFLFFFSAFSPIAVSIALFFTIGAASVIAFNFALVLCQQIIQNVEASNTKTNSPRIFGAPEYTLENHLFFESGLIVGRVLSCLLLIFIGFFGASVTLLCAVLTVLLSLFALHAILLFSWNKKYFKPTPQVV